MKRFYNLLQIALILTLLLSEALFNDVTGQVPPPPPPNGGPSNGHGLGGNQGPEGAPIGSGSEILVILGALYTSKKVYYSLKSKDG
jgi:hypothetical protein